MNYYTAKSLAPLRLFLSQVSTQDSGNFLQKPTLQRENVKQNNTVIFNNEPKTHHKFRNLPKSKFENLEKIKVNKDVTILIGKLK